MTRCALTLAALILVCYQAPAAAHPEHSRADSVEGAAMAAVVKDYHHRIARQDSSAYHLLAPAYVQAEVAGPCWHWAK